MSEEIDEVLTATLNDLRLSRSEQKTIRDLLDSHRLGPSELGLWRSRAFALARQAFAQHPHELVLEWLDEVMKAILTTIDQPSHPKRLPQAFVHFSPGDSCWQAIVHRLENARATADLCIFTITDDRITNAVLNAHSRRVSVRIISDDLKSTDLGSDIHRLQQSGIHVRTDRQLGHMHHKFALIDRKWLITGSYNWTRGAASDNLENLLVLNHDHVVRAFQAEFDRLWTAFA